MLWLQDICESCYDHKCPASKKPSPFILRCCICMEKRIIWCYGARLSFLLLTFSYVACYTEVAKINILRSITMLYVILYICIILVFLVIMITLLFDDIRVYEVWLKYFLNIPIQWNNTVSLHYCQSIYNTVFYSTRSPLFAFSSHFEIYHPL